MRCFHIMLLVLLAATPAGAGGGNLRFRLFELHARKQSMR